MLARAVEDAEIVGALDQKALRQVVMPFAKYKSGVKWGAVDATLTLAVQSLHTHRPPRSAEEAVKAGPQVTCKAQVAGMELLRCTSPPRLALRAGA